MHSLSAGQLASVLKSLRSAAEAGGSDKRKFTRMEIQAKVTVAVLAGGKVSRCFTGLTRDISVSGIGLFQHTPVEPESNLLIRLPCGDQQLDVLCVAKFCRPVADGVFDVGAQFTALADPALSTQVQKSIEDTADRIRKRMLD